MRRSVVVPISCVAIVVRPQTGGVEEGRKRIIDKDTTKTIPTPVGYYLFIAYEWLHSPSHGKSSKKALYHCQSECAIIVESRAGLRCVICCSTFRLALYAHTGPCITPRVTGRCRIHYLYVLRMLPLRGTGRGKCHILFFCQFPCVYPLIFVLVTFTLQLNP